MGTVRSTDLKIVVTRSDVVSTARWKIQTQIGGTTVDSGEAGSYKLACAAAGEAFDRLTAPQELDVMERMREYQQRTKPPGQITANYTFGAHPGAECSHDHGSSARETEIGRLVALAVSAVKQELSLTEFPSAAADAVVRRVVAYCERDKVPFPNPLSNQSFDWQAEAQRATQQYNNLLATVTAALAELDAFPGKYEYGQGVCDAIKVFRRHLTPKPAKDPAIVRALQEALRAYREVSHDRVNGDDVKAMAAAIAAYETEKAKP